MAKASSMRGAEDPTDDELAAERAEAVEPKFVTVEYVGHPPYGREFMTSHTIYKSPADGRGSELSFGGQGIEVPETLVWSAANGWKVRVPAELTELLEALATQADLKVRN